MLSFFTTLVWSAGNVDMPALLFSRRRRMAESVRSSHALVNEIRHQARELEASPDSELRQRADDLRDVSFANANTHHSANLATAFVLVVEAARRALGIDLYDVQLLGGFALVKGHVAEMQTGEGKTFTTLLPAFACSLSGRGVHVATSNAYLATRDCRELAPVFELLGVSVGLITREMTPQAKRAAYESEITFGPGYEFGFDYLRDQVTLRTLADRPLGDAFLSRLRFDSASRRPTLQRRLAASIVDEIDNVLIDDACSPLLLSAEADRTADDVAAHVAARDLADQLQPSVDYQLDHQAGATSLTEAGLTQLWSSHDQLPQQQLLKRPWPIYVEQALRAKELVRRDVHYVVRDGKIVIVDETTGRLFAERAWSDGLHQAVEARERVAITSEKISLARISRQRFARRYEKLCGMTGTATGSEREFREFFQLDVTSIATHRPCRRETLAPRYFIQAAAKWDAIAKSVADLHANGRPVLVGTKSIQHSEYFADLLSVLQIPFRLLNGRQDADEAAIIAEAGRAGAVTIATNMAGRGTDIQPDEEALGLGGLHVIVSEHHDSSRIDRQLMGRAARQGDPGSVQVFVSGDDDLISRHGAWFRREIQRLPHRSGEISIDLSAPVHRIQSQAERAQYMQRRQAFYQEQQRDELLERVWK